MGKKKKLSVAAVRTLAERNNKRAVIVFHFDRKTWNMSAYGMNKELFDYARELGNILKGKAHEILGENLNEHWLKFLQELEGKNEVRRSKDRSGEPVGNEGEHYS